MRKRNAELNAYLKEQKMTWHLKDRELEKKLIEVCPNFFNELNLSLSGVPDGHKFGFVYVEFHRQFGDNRWVKSKLAFFDREVEYVQDYNPKAWNEYPKVIPPRHEPLRVEFADKSGTKAFFDDCLREYVTAKRIDRPCRYRPWEG